MKASLPWFVVFASLCWGFFAIPAFAQEAVPAEVPKPPAAPSTGTRVAVLNLQEVFKQHIHFVKGMTELRKETEELGSKTRIEQMKLQKMVEELKAIRIGTPEYKAREEELAQIESNVRNRLMFERKDLRDKEAKLHYVTYVSVLAVVKDYADHHGIGLVIRYNDETMDPANPESIMMGLNRHVIYQRDLDITAAIIAKLNEVPAADGEKK